MKKKTAIQSIWDYTECCALDQLYLGGSEHLHDIKRIMEYRKNEGTNALFCISLGRERKLVSNLKKLGFKAITTFKSSHRGKYKLTMWFKEI